MATTVFAPSPKPDPEQATGGAEAVYLDKALFVLRGSIEDPTSGDKDKALPPHRFALIHTTQKAFGAESATSGPNGLVVVPDLPKSMREGSGADDTWELLLIPVFDDGGNSDEYGLYKDVWLDVDAWTWVRPTEVWKSPPSEYGFVHVSSLSKLQQKKRLLRVPAWSTARKAASGGGFLEAHPKGSEFAEKGTLKTSEISQHGTAGAPWKMRLDHGWLKRHVMFVYYDLSDKKNKPIPKGVVAQAVSTEKERFAGSSVRFDDGVFYMLIAGDEARVKDKLHYAFATPKTTRFPYAADFLETLPSWDVARLPTHRALPKEWHSQGAEAWVGPGDPSASNRKPFTDVRLAGASKSEPLCFHLDDIALLRPDKAVSSDFYVPIEIKTPDGHVALFDHDLKLIDPDNSALGKPVGRSKRKVARQPLRAEEFYYTAGKGLEGTVRLIEYEGFLCEIAGGANELMAGAYDFVGARAGRAPPVLDDHSQYKAYLIDVPYRQTTYKGKSAAAAHIFVHLPTWTDDSWLLGSNTEAVPRIEQGLLFSSESWTQKHPAFSGGAKKEYVVIPASGDPDPVVRLRFHFSGRAQEDGRPTKLRPEPKGRATAGGMVRLYLEYGPDLDPPEPQTKPAEAKKPYSAIDASETSDTDGFDGTEARTSTLTHELGHVRGITDEYLEGFDAVTRVHKDAPGFLARFQQSTTAKPFHNDWRAMMKGNRFMRLRYANPFVTGLNGLAADPGHWAATKRPFLIESAPSKATMRYTFAGADPWTETKTGELPLAHIALYELGDDESSRGLMFLPDAKTPLGAPFDGVAVIYPQFWFKFSVLYSSLERWDVMRGFGEPYLDVSKTPHFMVEWPTDSTFRRVALLLQPRFEYGPAPTILDASATPPQLESISRATVRVEVETKPGIVLATSVEQATGKVKSCTLTATPKNVNRGLMKLALSGDPASFSGAMATDDAPFVAADFGAAAGVLANMLGRAKPTVVPYG